MYPPNFGSVCNPTITITHGSLTFIYLLFFNKRDSSKAVVVISTQIAPPQISLRKSPENNQFWCSTFILLLSFPGLLIPDISSVRMVCTSWWTWAALIQCLCCTYVVTVVGQGTAGVHKDSFLALTFCRSISRCTLMAPSRLSLQDYPVAWIHPLTEFYGKIFWKPICSLSPFFLVKIWMFFGHMDSHFH